MNAPRQTRIAALRRLLTERILVVDGAMGTSIQQRDLTAADFGGEQYEGCNEYLNITRPDVIRDIHRSFLDAGADIIETNSFGSMSIVLAEYNLAPRAREISRAAARIAREAADAASTPALPRFVAGSIGPTNKSISVTGGVTFDTLAASYAEQAAGLIEGGADLLLIETSQDPINVKAALEGCDRAIAQTGEPAPIAVQATVEAMGTLLAGQDIEAFYTTLAHRDLLWIGLNCATGPEFMTDHVRTLAGLSRFPIACIPNAGLPDEHGRYNETPEMIAATLRRFIGEGWVNVLGGCCGTVPSHIRQIAAAAKGQPPHKPLHLQESRVAGLEPFVINQDTRPVLVGERTNVLGSRKFKQLIAQGAWDEAAEVGRRQVREGAHIVDVCLQDPDRDELADLIAFLENLTKKIKAPIMLDSTDAHVIEEGLKRTPGKSIINSINLEDGESRFQLVTPLARRYGAALVVGCIDDDKQQAQAITRKRKLAIAQRSHDLLTQKYGIPPEDILFDALVFPIGTGDKNYIGAGAETIEGIRLIKEALPRCKTILGISNVSFGLPASGREVLNAVFLYHCVQAGLDLAIVNTERLMRYPSIPEVERTLAEDLIWWRGDDPIAAFTAHFRGKAAAPAPKDDRRSLPLDQRLARCIVDGSKEGLLEDLDEALKARTPLQIINGPLMTGMDEVGRLFNDNRLIVAEVLQSAEAMKAAVRHLEPHMEKGASSNKGTILLATVKGDVHDIGKNLVEIILANNGYRVVNLGIKVPPQEIIAACLKHQPDAIGLSGLLVKSAQMMVETAKDLKAAGIACPVLVGGAALTNRFTRLRIATVYDGLVAYAREAMDGLSLANRIMDADQRETLRAGLDKTTLDMQRQGQAEQPQSQTMVRRGRSAAVRQDIPIPLPPDLKLHVLRNHDLDAIFKLINPMMLYVRHLGFKGRFPEALAQEEPKALELRAAVRRVEEQMLARKDIHAAAAFKFFPAQSDDQWLRIYTPDGKAEIGRFFFGRQTDDAGLSLVDYVAEKSSGRMDYVALFVTTIGNGVRALADDWKERGDYLASHILQSLALESAEAFAELVHQQIRRAWGFADPPQTTPQELFKAHYRGRRYSFGYPACPRLEDQEELFRLLDVEQHLPVRLTEGHMMDPESSVSALVVHHPDAAYFNLSPADAAALEREIAAAHAQGRRA
ncbi:MAG: methionine synthase [Dehalococcoidia bacterium]|nr:methionine synthase [Dehalococcoidia bacterium]